MEEFKMRIENPIWNETFRENLPRWIHIWVVSIVLISTIVFGLNNLFNFVSKDNLLVKLLSILGVLFGGLLIFNRDMYLPFLSENFVPEIFLNIKERRQKNIEKTIEIRVEPDTLVLYWAADPGKEVRKNWKLGYNKFENSGVVKSDAQGMAKIPIVCPSRYIVHGYKILPKHVHYRTYNKNNQMLSRIQMVTLKNECK
jgi:hypothetical protein